MGHTAFAELHVLAIIEQLTREWQPDDYHLLEQNCCHFCDILCWRLGVRGVPKRIFLMSQYGEACIAGKPCACNQRPVCDRAENVVVPLQEVPCHHEINPDDILQPMCHLPVLTPRGTEAAFESQGSRTTVMYAEGYEGIIDCKRRAHSIDEVMHPVDCKELPQNMDDRMIPL